MADVTKADVVDAVVKETGVGRSEAKAVINGVLNCITAKLANGESVGFAGFGTFGVKTLKEREYRNPFNGGTVIKPKRNSPAFKPGKPLREAVQSE